MAAYLARRRFGYSAAEIARALGYRGHGGVGNAVRQVEAAGQNILAALRELEERLANV